MLDYLPPLEVDCLACSNGEIDCFGAIRFRIQEVIGPVLFMSRPGCKTKSISASSKPSLEFFPAGKTLCYLDHPNQTGGPEYLSISFTALPPRKFRAWGSLGPRMKGKIQVEGLKFPGLRADYNRST